MQKFFINPFLRLRPPKEFENNFWFAENLKEKRAFNIPYQAALVLSFLNNCINKTAVIEKSSLYTKCSKETIEKLFDNLLNKNLIIQKLEFEKLNSEIKASIKLCENSSNAWKFAMDYHIATHDFPFLDYSPTATGRIESNERMRNYSTIEKDISRYKVFSELFPRFHLPTTEAAEEYLVNNLNNSHSAQTKDIILTLKSIFSLVFGVTKRVSIQWEGENLIRRTSPSGGSRHPNEGYLFCRINNELNGVFHIQSDQPCLTKINDLPSEEDLKVFIPGISNKPFSPFCVVLITCVFERNMFRYREPRTFRSVHMDAGHLACTFNTLIKEQGLECDVQTDSLPSEITSLLGNNPLDEGIMCSICVNIDNI